MTKFLAPTHVVVYADDDPDDIELVEDAFKRYANNVEVVTFRDASHALSYLKSQTDLDPLPCLVILDINMPLMDGKEALIQLRQLERYEAIPVVLFTTSSQPVDAAFAKRYDAGFITKPLGYEQMEIITKQFIDRCNVETQKEIRKIK
jgi:CheY-like chemotaxis protein